MERDQAVQDNNNIILDGNSISDSSLDSQDSNGSDSDDESDGNLDDSTSEAAQTARTQLPCMLSALGLKVPDKGRDGSLLWTHLFPIIVSMTIAKDVGVRMMEEYYEIKSLKETPQYRVTMFDDDTEEEREKNTQIGHHRTFF